MAVDDDFIEPDPFDPVVIRQAEEAQYEERNAQTDVVRRYIETRRRAYKAVFTGKGEHGDIEFVMRDLAAFCRAYEPTFNMNPKVQDLLEGRREVFMRIMSFMHLSHDTLYVQYTDAKTRGN